MIGNEEKSRIEYAALHERAREAERMAQLSWIVPGLVATALLAYGIGDHSPGFLVSVVLTAAVGFLSTCRWREQAASVMGYIEAYHESEGDNPSFFGRLGRLSATQPQRASHEWHVTTFLNLVSVTAAIVAWTAAASSPHGELWAGVVTACALGFASYSVSETVRLHQNDPAAPWRRAESGLREVKRTATH